MKLVKIFSFFIILILLGLGSSWYYVTSQVAQDINAQYAGKKMPIKGLNKQAYFVAFDNISPAGFPYKISWKVNGWSEESREAKITYHSPIYFGYDLLLQKLFVTYDGEVTAAYKTAGRGFGAKLKIEDYAIEVDLPLTSKLLQTLKSIKNRFGIMNHIKGVSVSSGSVDVFDLVNNEKFYDKEFEKLQLSFIPQKEYKNIEDFLNNIPQDFNIKYTVKTKPNEAKTRRLPESWFYAFSALPSGFDIDANIDIKTKGNNIEEIKKGLDVKVEAKCASPFVNFNDVKFKYKGGMDKLGRDYSAGMSSKIFFKEGMFDEAFHRYAMFAPKLVTSPAGRKIDQEVRYIIANQKAFKFKELENQEYDYNLQFVTSENNKRKYVRIDDFSIFSKESGIKLKHEMETLTKNKSKSTAEGVLFIKNYPSVVEFSSGYIYRFGKFKFLKDEARALYIDVNKAFLKSISDHPKSKSNDLSFEYSGNPNDLTKVKIGSVKVDQIAKLYSLMLYQKLFKKVGHGGDVLGRMKDIIPDLDENEPFLKKILPRISGEKTIEESIQKQIDKALPGKTGEALKKALPKDLTKGLLKGFLK